MSAAPSAHGARIIGTGSWAPEKVLSNADLEKMFDTSDEWIRQRTGIRERRILPPDVSGSVELSSNALERALVDNDVDPKSIELLIVATCTHDIPCPSVACRVAARCGLANSGAFDLVAACSGFVSALVMADALVRCGRYRRVAVVGSDAMSHVLDYSERTVSILFGDAAGAAIVERTDDPSKGSRYDELGADGSQWESLYLPQRACDLPESDRDNPIALGKLRMNGREVFKFAVKKFQEVIADALEATGVAPTDVEQYIVHQSNARIIEAAREKLGIDPDRVYVNIDRFGNSSAGSVGLCLDQLWRAGKIPEDRTIVFAAFGGGLTWASCVWDT